MYTKTRAELRKTLDEIKSAGLYKQERLLDSPQAPHVESGDRDLLNFCSNNYLGLANHPDVIAAAKQSLDANGFGMASVRFICGTQSQHDELESRLSRLLGTDATILFPSCFDANGGVFEVLLDQGDAVISDELNHASIIDGTRLSRSETAIFPHRDLDALDALLGRARGRRAVVASDTVFSMDGDLADVDGLRAVCARHGALLVLDEAHAVLGPEVDAGDEDIVRVGTLSKTLGALGGFVAGPQRYTDLIVNRARSYIFTTASSPADSAAALAAIGVVRSPEGDALRTRLRSNIDALWRDHPSPIVPIICGEERAALDAAACLLEQGMLVPAIRPPTVAAGTSRLRIALSAAHTPEEVAALAAALRGLGLA